MDVRDPYNAADVAWRTGLPIPQVRYYAALYGDFLGGARAPLGEWRFRDEHLPFFRALAEGLPLAAAIRAVAPLADGPGPASFHGVPAGAISQAAAAPPASPAEASPPGPTPAETRKPETKPTTPSSDMEERLDELGWQMQDLLEETKQVQILLSRILTLLEAQGDTSSPRPAPPKITAGNGLPGETAAGTPSRTDGTTGRPRHAAAPAASRETVVIRHDQSVRAWEPRAL